MRAAPADAPTHAAARAVYRRYGITAACNASAGGQHECHGPFPYLFGPFLALARPVVRALVASAALRQELSRLAAPAAAQKLLVDQLVERARHPA